jgi:hypothetical protein
MRNNLGEYYYKGERNYENNTAKQCCESRYGSLSGLNGVPGSVSRSGSRRAKMFSF